MEGSDKGNNVKVKVRRREFSDIGWDVVAIISATKMCNIRRQFSNRKIVHAFIESGTGCNLDLGGSMLHQRMFLCCVRNAAKKDHFLRIWAKFSGVMSGRANPDTTSKALDVGEVFLFASCKHNWGL